MTKKKNIASKLVLVLFVLTLISCCLLGSTFARYASGGSGTASVGVALWDVGITDSSTSSFSTVDLSPSKGEWNGTTARTHSTGKVLVATIENSGDVDALVKVTAGDLAATLLQDHNWDATGYAVDGQSYTGNGASEAQTEALFSIAFFTDDATTFDGGQPLSPDGYNLAVGNTIYIFAEVTWTSADQGTNAAYADALDTWVGENVASVGCTLTYSAVQNSTRPTT